MKIHCEIIHFKHFQCSSKLKKLSPLSRFRQDTLSIYGNSPTCTQSTLLDLSATFDKFPYNLDELEDPDKALLHHS